MIRKRLLPSIIVAGCICVIADAQPPRSPPGSRKGFLAPTSMRTKDLLQPASLSPTMLRARPPPRQPEWPMSPREITWRLLLPSLRSVSPKTTALPV
jgi:hypothetical protein